MAPVVLARQLVKRYGPLEAVRGIDFAVGERECFGFLGPNGAGKTTTMRMIACASPPTAGALAVLDQPVDRAREIKRRMGVVPQENNLDEMHFGRVYDAVLATPLSVEDIGLGELLWATSRSLIYGVVFLGIAAAFGVVHTPLVLLAPVAIALVGLHFAVVGLAFSAAIPLIDYFTYYWTIFLTPMFLFAGVFFPLDRLPPWVGVVAWFMPLHQAVVLMRALMLTGDVGQAASAAAWLIVVTAALFPLPLALLRRRLVR